MPPARTASAAWNDVPQPVKSTRASSGSRRSPTRRAPALSQSGCTAMACRVRLSWHERLSIPSRAVAIFEKTTLGNGVRVLTAPFPQVGSVSCFVMLAAGSRYETPESKGIAHFAEHMFFKGTERTRRPHGRSRPRSTRSAASSTRSPGKELTGYYVRCGSETRDVALDVLTDMLLHSRFDEAEIAKEKGVILEEMNVYLDTPQRYVGNVYDRLLYADQPLGWDILGTRETIEGSDARDLHLVPGHLVPARAHGRRRSAAASATASRSGSRSSSAASRRDRRVRPPKSSYRPTRPRSSCTRRPRSRRTSSSACAAIRSGTQPVRARSCSPSCSAGACRRGSSPRCANAGPRLLRHAGNDGVHGHGDVLRERRGGRRARRRGDHDDPRRAAEDRVRAGPAGRARRRRAATRRGASCSASRARRERSSTASAREVLEGEIEEPDELLRRLDEVTVEDVQRVARDLFEGKRLYLALVGPFDDPARFEQLLAA